MAGSEMAESGTAAGEMAENEASKAEEPQNSPDRPETAPDAQAASKTEDQASSGQSDPEPVTAEDGAKTPAAAETQVTADSAEENKSAEAAETKNGAADIAVRPDDQTATAKVADPTKQQNPSGSSKPVQQAALPKVAAPDYNSLPLWQRNRQNIDQRWLKDADGNPKPRIAFVLSELGHASIAAEEIIKKLPPAITLSFSPYAKPRSLEYLSALARANGHEVMLDLPLEPIDFPQRDPGPNALLTALEPEENLARLAWSLERTTGYVGVAVWMGSRFVGSPRQMRPLFKAIEERGIILLDNAERENSLSMELAGEFSVPTLISHRYVDVPLASRDAIDARLAQVERIALQFGSAIAMGRPFPVTVERLAEWSTEIEKRGIVLVPISVLAEEAVSKQELAQRAPVNADKTKAKNSSSGSEVPSN
ncbi:divergent polysaccharide deacetylase family protein [Denitrobaculum tricleocarpae]|uniref:Divergent polysaccharide deacetylase family protein n=1 Tax=Denitrobaculum tricleocarpae TaxID=2591009 RepID=A0A545TQR0_9PROT|nr:divergent polysaccharide deacetylase family protein [Denitrobaculum tricleocarpae]TQV79559.1 hypothetical protein FKG95_12585 [Denitrobaculum tricleocarpae]